ncbi:MAG: hypothetical protein ACRELZ_24735 [Candidatus Rokuibacteriota bacterium]
MILELAFAASSHASDDDARRLLEALGSAHCETRLEAISRYSRSEDDEQNENAALKKLSLTAPPATREQARALLSDLEDERKGTARLLALVEKISQLNTLDKGRRNRSIWQFRDEFVKIIASPKESITARIGASWPLVRILLAARGDHPEWTTEWAQSVGTMLKSPDGVLRVVGATTAALGRFPEGNDPVKIDIVRPLIDGLRHDSVSVRSAAHVGLRLTLDGPNSGICFNATDSADRRAAAIQRWEEWWHANQGKLARERVEQRFW